MEEKKPEDLDYQSLLLRIWRVERNDDTAWRASLEHIDGGEKLGFSTLDDLFAYIRTRFEPSQKTPSETGQ
jgi:hypothetical protein